MDCHAAGRLEKRHGDGTEWVWNQVVAGVVDGQRVCLARNWDSDLDDRFRFLCIGSRKTDELGFGVLRWLAASSSN
jgi:hypothetical protein